MQLNVVPKGQGEIDAGGGLLRGRFGRISLQDGSWGTFGLQKEVENGLSGHFIRRADMYARWEPVMACVNLKFEEGAKM